MIPAPQAKALAEVYLDGIEREFPTTRKVIAAIPEDKMQFKLGDKGRTAAEIAWHIVLTEAWFAESLAAGSFGAESEAPIPATVAEILAWYDGHVPALTEKVKALGGEDFARQIDFYHVYNMPAFAYLSFWTVHSIHHRGYLAAYLRAMNAHVPSIYGGSADEPFQMPATA
jgi:uncharacterized damage-inducible protein DinB